MRLILLTLILTFSLLAKDDELENPIMPLGATFQLDNLRLLLGVGQNFQMGEFTTENWCECPPFREGVGQGFTFALHYERELAGKLYWGIGARLDNYGFESRYIDNQFLTVTPIDDNSEAESQNQRVPFYQITESNITGVGLNPQLRWYPFEWLMLRFGVNVSYIINYNIVHTEELLNNVTQDGQFIIRALDDTPRYDGDFPDVNNIYSSLLFGIALPFTLPNDFSISPGFEYGHPLTPFSNSYDFNVGTWRITFEFKYPLTSDKYKKTKSRI